MLCEWERLHFRVTLHFKMHLACVEFSIVTNKACVTLLYHSVSHTWDYPRRPSQQTAQALSCQAIARWTFAMTDFRNGVLYYRGTAADDIAATDKSAPWIHKSRDAWWCLCCHKGGDDTHLESGPHRKWIGSYATEPEKWRCQEIPTAYLDAHYLPKICD